MTKRDWTALFIRILGLYLIATHVATFAVTTTSLILASTQKADAAARAASQYLWTGPLASAMVLLIGVILLKKAGGLATTLLKNDK